VLFDLDWRKKSVFSSFCFNVIQNRFNLFLNLIDLRFGFFDDVFGFFSQFFDFSSSEVCFFGSVQHSVGVLSSMKNVGDKNQISMHDQTGFAF
jgi:hypothetical protein